jgi:hypothetical protein
MFAIICLGLCQMLFAVFWFARHAADYYCPLYAAEADRVTGAPRPAAISGTSKKLFTLPDGAL